MSSSRPSTTVTGSTADCRRKSPLRRAKAVGLKISSKDTPLNLLCLTLGPPLDGASLGTVAAILSFRFVSIIASHHHGLPIVARSVRALARGRATSGLDACVRGLVAGLADHEPSALRWLEIWRFVAEHIEHRPISAWGLDLARRLSGGTSQVIIHHCDAADLTDVGGPGALGPTQAMIAGTTVAAVSVGLLSFGIWQEWFLSSLCVSAAFVVHAARQSAAARGALLHGAK